MHLVLKLPQDSDGHTWDRDSSALMSVVGKTHPDEARISSHLTDDVDGALRMGAALRAAHQGNTGGKLPDVPEQLELLIAQPESKPPSASPSDEQSLRDDLLANDSLGG